MNTCADYMLSVLRRNPTVKDTKWLTNDNCLFVFNLRLARYWQPVRRLQLMPISWTMTPIIHSICALLHLFLCTVDVLLRSVHCLVPATAPHTKGNSAGSHRYAETSDKGYRKKARANVVGFSFLFFYKKVKCQKSFAWFSLTITCFILDRWLRLEKMSLVCAWAHFSSVKTRLKKQDEETKLTHQL